MSEGRIKKLRQKESIVDILIVYSLLVSLGFPGTYSQVIGSALSVIFEYSAFFAEIAILILSSGDRLMDFKLIRYDRRDNLSYLLVAEIFIVSVSVARSTVPTIISCTRFAVTACYGLWLTENYDIERILELFHIAQTVFVVFSVLLLVIRPSLALYTSPLVSNAFRGIFSTKNPAGAELSCMLIFEGILLKVKKTRGKPVPQWYLIVYLVQWMMLLATRASGAILSTLIVTIYILFFSKHRLPVGWVYVAGNIGWLIIALNFIPMIAPLLEAMGKDATLTGRIPMWQRVVEFMMENKTLTGTGFGRFWVEPKDYTRIQAYFDANSFWGNAVAGAHNCILELWLNCGLLGIAAFFAAILYATRRIDEISEESYMVVGSFFIFLLIGGLTERIFDAFHYRTLFMFVSMGLACRRAPIPRYFFSWQIEKMEEAEKQKALGGEG